MSPTAATFDLPLELIATGKVRDIYALDDERLLFVTSDRISAYDVVMNEQIPDKGRVLTGMTKFWLERASDVPNHLISMSVADLPEEAKPFADDLNGRFMIVRRL